VSGPEKFRHEPLRSVFESCRATLITTHLILRRRTFLELESWTTVPWMLDPGSKSHQSHIADVLVSIPGLLEDAEIHTQSPARNQPIDLLIRIKSQLEKLYNWRWAWEVANSLAVWEVDTSSADPSVLCRQHPAGEKELHFATASQSTEIMAYNAALLWLLSLLGKLEPLRVKGIVDAAAAPGRSLFLSSSSLLFRPGETYSLRGPATEICRCYDYQIRYGRQSRESSLFYLFPLALAGTVLKEDPQFSAWIRVMLNSSPTTSGYGVDQSNVYGFRFYLTPESLNLR
jgi:hypothetical protein